MLRPSLLGHRRIRIHAISTNLNLFHLKGDCVSKSITIKINKERKKKALFLFFCLFHSYIIIPTLLFHSYMKFHVLLNLFLGPMDGEFLNFCFKVIT
jgi:hypothetical protein